ncbi:MAG: hypothetical protein ACK46O_00990 [Flavobacteriia bacterium]
MILIIIGGIVVLRFIGQLLIAKRNMEEERKLNARQREAENERSEKLKNCGKVNILGGRNTRSSDLKGDVQDIEYEDVE